MEILTVTPQLAQKMLDCNYPDNRKLNAERIRKYAHDMSTGRWLMNGDPIRFNKEGFMFDGQHRCKSIVASNATITTIVQYGLDRDVMETIDTGRSRTPADALRINGEKGEVKFLSSISIALVMIARFEKDYAETQGSTAWGSIRPRIQNSDIFEFVENNRERLNMVIPVAKALHKACFIPPASGGAALFNTMKANHFQATQFYEGLLSGVGYHEGDPRLALRNYLVLKKAHLSLTEGIGYAYYQYVKAFNAFVAGSKIKILKTPTTLTPIKVTGLVV
jgi:hypothetical protein